MEKELENSECDTEDQRQMVDILREDPLELEDTDDTIWKKKSLKRKIVTMNC